MRSVVLAVCCLFYVVFSATFVGAQDSLSASPVTAAADPAVAPIYARIDSYVEAFNRGDAKALAAHWSPEGDYAAPDGRDLKGRQQLEDAFAGYFSENKNAKIELVDTSVDLLAPSVAIEKGIARVIVPNQEPTESHYEAIHVKSGDNWLIDRVGEVEQPPAAPSHHEQLQSLDWMVGSWVNGDADSSIEITCRWTTNQNFLVRTFRVFIADRVDFEGTQVIGWDPYAGAIRSWIFDSDGGFGVGRWSQDEGRWVVATLNILPDGRRGTSTNIYELVDENTVEFSSIGRQVDGELLPSIDSVTVVRASAE